MISENKITVYTPTYNRAYCLVFLYQSLLRQKNENFEWLIIDDGSTDNTKEIIGSWILEDRLKIKYYQQENKGKQDAVNLAHELINTELSVCVDSDDYLVDDAIDFIIKKWDEIKQDTSLAGFVGLDAYKSGEVIGTSFPENLKKSKFSHFNTIHDIKGDKKFIYRTDIIKRYPKYPTFENEKFPAPGYLYRLIDQDYNLYLVNKVLCIVEYMPDGISKNKFLQFKKCPNSFVFYRLERMRMAVNFIDKFKNAVHYINSCIYARKNLFKNNPYLFTTLLALPFGVALNFYIKYTNKKGVV